MCSYKHQLAHAIDLQFNNENVRVTNVEMVKNFDAAASRFIETPPGTVNNGIALIADRCKFYNTSGTEAASAIGGTMGVGYVAMVNECFTAGCAEVGTAGSILVAPASGAGTVQTGGLHNPYIGVGTAMVVSLAD